MRRLVGQLLAYLIFAGAVGWLAQAPPYVAASPTSAQIKLSLNHAGARKVQCKHLSAQELADLPANMRSDTMNCPRERVAVRVQLELDGRFLVDESVEPTGLWHDGPSVVYRRLAVTPGRHHLIVRLADGAQGSAFNYTRSVQIELAERQSFVVDFRSDLGGFVFH